MRSQQSRKVQRVCSTCCACHVFDDHNEGGDTSCKLIAHRKALVEWEKEIAEFDANNGRER